MYEVAIYTIDGYIIGAELIYNNECLSVSPFVVDVPHKKQTYNLIAAEFYCIRYGTYKVVTDLLNQIKNH